MSAGSPERSAARLNARSRCSSNTSLRIGSTGRLTRAGVDAKHAKPVGDHPDVVSSREGAQPEVEVIYDWSVGRHPAHRVPDITPDGGGVVGAGTVDDVRKPQRATTVEPVTPVAPQRSPSSCGTGESRRDQ